MMPYTGNTDPSTGPRPGIVKLIEILGNRYKMVSLGVWANRPMRGSNPPRLSVHATGRAGDIGYKKEQADLIGKVALWLAEHHETLGIEEIHDYNGVSKAGTGMWGRGFRCSRKELGGKPGWKDWTATDNGGTPGMGTMASCWLHIELSPHMSDNPKDLVKAFKSISDTAPPALP